MKKIVYLFILIFLVITLSACTSESYSVVFNGNEPNNTDASNIPESIVNIKKNTKVNEPKQIPVLEGFEFTGWYKQTTCLKLWDFSSDVVSKNVTLYAGWEEIKNHESESANTFRITYASVLALTVELVAISDKESITNALVAYSSLDSKVQELLEAEKSLIDYLLAEIASLENISAEVNNFKEVWKTILSKTSENVNIADKSEIESAIDNFNKLLEDSKMQLTSELILLSLLLSEVADLDTIINSFKTTHNYILSLTVDTVTISHKASVILAISIYDSFDSEIKSELTDEKLLLDSLLEEINSLPTKAGNFDCPEAFDTTKDVEIEFWHTMSAMILQPVLNEAIANFQELYPNIKVTHMQIGGFSEVLNQVLSNANTGTYPSMAYCYSEQIPLYNQADLTVTLDDLIKNKKYGFGGSELEFEGPKEKDFVEGFLSESRSYGYNMPYSMPFIKATEALFYNEKFFADNNLSVPTTWDEMWELCKRIKEIDPNSIPLGVDSESNLFITMAKQYGYDYTTSDGEYKFDNEGNRNLMINLKDKYDKEYFTTSSILGSYADVVYTSTYTSKRMYMTISSTTGASYKVPSDSSFTTGVAVLPQANISEPKSLFQGPSICLFKNDDPQVVLASWLFLQYLLTDSVQASFSVASGYIPVTKTAILSPQYITYLLSESGSKGGLSARASLVAISQNNAYFTPPVFIGSANARDQVGSLLVSIISGQKTVDKAFKDALDACK